MPGLRILMMGALMMALLLPLAVPGGATAATPEDMRGAGLKSLGQPLPDSDLAKLRGRVSLIGFGSGLTDVVIQVNQGTGTQVNKANGIVLTGPGTQIEPLPPHFKAVLQSLSRLFRRR